ncbi:MAG TPA: FkbM family methyltransferase [Pyrinomonadaceae bacterium]|jgi:FkbM family methyltransferase
MNLLRRTARTVSNTLGRESGVINALRPAYDRMLDWSSRGKGIVQTINGHEQIRIDPRHRAHVPEVYDPEVCRYLRERVQPGAVCLNIGAHVGIYALCLAQWSRPGGRVYAFEPNPATRAALEKHVALNDAGEQIEVIAQAVSEAQDEAEFFATELEGFSRLGQPNPEASHEKLTAVTVPITSVDAFCAGRKLSPDWITMDIEGYEIAALSGARETIKAARGRLRLIVEMHPGLWLSTERTREQLETLIAEMNLTPVCLTGQADPFADYGIVLLEDKEHSRKAT